MTTTLNKSQTKLKVQIYSSCNEISLDISERLERKYKDIRFDPLSAQVHKESCNCILFIVNGYERKTTAFIHKLVSMNSKIPILLVYTDGEDKNLFTYLNHPISGIASLTFVEEHFQMITKELESHHVFIEPAFHRELVLEIERKKQKDKPIDKLVLKRSELKGVLTENEQNVLQLILDGFNNRTIAEKLFLAPSTVSTIISHLLRKIGANDRTEAIILAIREGWVDAYR
ncbi:LuxR C-terminal-related transcriptional regulator [Bacillus shivajii]|uniref:response regulator transcription factor n=1 Tax=Bacillus shivajii TaxID=1983719 RepID=UPI001CFAA247|nr:LuxR C-terminal-related transcriptional regulator [Bacillus shivajii]UCZ52690.1 LuxR C-terminal-related transcriptional regulator [Bacillus shivajii]